MYDVMEKKTVGILKPGWSATVGDYAIAGGWLRHGKELVVGDTAGGIFTFDGDSGKTIWEQKEVHEGGLLAISIHPNGTSFATAGQDGRVLIWSFTGQIIQTIELGQGWVENVAWSPEGKWLAASISRQVRLFDSSGKEIWRSNEHPSTVSAIAWSGAELATACYGRVSFFDAPTGRLQQKMEWKGSLVSMVLSSDREIVACGSQDNSVHFWRRSTEQDSMMSGYPNKPSSLAFDSTSTLLATGGGNEVMVWSFQGDGPEGTSPGILETHTQPVTTLSFAQDTMLLASGARDGSVVVWFLQSNAEGGPVGATILSDAVSELYWRPDSNALATLDAHGGVRVLQVVR